MFSPEVEVETVASLTQGPGVVEVESLPQSLVTVTTAPGDTGAVSTETVGFGDIEPPGVLIETVTPASPEQPRPRPPETETVVP